jgi:hypothetical protein
MNTGTKGNPVPVRFETEEDQFLREAQEATGMPVSEIIRRSVRLMKRQKQIVQSYGFILELKAA